MERRFKRFDRFHFYEGEIIFEIIMKNQSEEAKDFINLGIVLNNKGEALMIKRVKPETGRDGSILSWAFPAGKQRYRETREECVKREILAETGYDVESVRQIDLAFHPQFSIMIVYHLCKLNNPEPIASPQEAHEVAEIKWVKPSEVRGLITTALNPKAAKELGIT